MLKNKIIIKETLKNKIYQIIMIGFLFDYIQKYHLKLQKNTKEENIFLKNITSYIKFSRTILISRIFDEDPKTFSVNNIATKIGLDIGNQIEKHTHKQFLKYLTIWRGNVFAHDNFEISIATNNSNGDIAPNGDMISYYYEYAENFLIDFLVNIEVFLDKKNLDVMQKIKNDLEKLKEENIKYALSILK